MKLFGIFLITFHLTGLLGNITPRYHQLLARQDGPVSQDGRCGKDFSNTVCAADNPVGTCCAQSGYCGRSPDHCSVDKGCQSNCKEPPQPEEPVPLSCGDGKCDLSSETCYSCPSDCKCNYEYLATCKGPGQVSLTFDDGPDKFSEDLMRVTAELGVKVTVFVIGEKLEDKVNQERLAKFHEAGHGIASHTYTHPFMTQKSDSELREEMTKTDDLIFKAIGVRPIYMRNPYADSNDRTKALIDAMGYKSIFTSLDSEDTAFGEKNSSQILELVQKGIEKRNPTSDSAIITQHETIEPSINYLPQIVKLVKDKGFQIVPLDQCITGTSSGMYRSAEDANGVSQNQLAKLKQSNAKPFTTLAPSVKYLSMLAIPLLTIL